MNNNEMLRKINKHEDKDIPELREQLDTKVSMFIDGCANIEYFRFLAENIGQDNENWTPAINKCLELYNNAYIPHNIKIGSKIILTKDNQKIIGSNRNVEIRTNGMFTDDCIIEIKDKRFPILKNFTLHGRLLKQSGEPTRNGLVINNTTGADLTATIENLFITMVNGNGLNVSGRGGDSIFNNIIVRDVMSNGVYISLADGVFQNIISGACGGDAFNISGGNNKFVNCKAWFATHGYYLTGLCARNTFLACESQDNIINWFVGGKDCEIDTLSESSGLQAFEVGYPYKYVADQPMIKFGADSSSNFVKIVCADRKEFLNDGSFDYLVDINGTSNKLVGTFRDLKKDIILNKAQLYSNIIEVQGLNNTTPVQFKYFYYNKQLNIYENSENKFSNIIKTPSIYDNNCSILKGGYTIKNGICYVNVEIKALKDFSYANILLNGFPKPLCDSPLMIYTDGKKTQININGELAVSSTVTTNDVYKINGSYPINTL